MSEGTTLIQFKVDKELGDKLSKVAQRLQTPIGPLSRLWVTQRLEQEMGKEPALEWRDKQLQKILDNQNLKRPLVIIHVIPLESEYQVLPGAMQASAGSFKPLFHGRSFVGRINGQGFRSSNTSAAEEREETSYVQMFRGGQLEAVGELHVEKDNFVYPTVLETQIIDRTSLYCLALNGLRVELPLRVYITLIGFNGLVFGIRRDHFLPSEAYVPITEEVITLPAIDIKDSTQIIEDGDTGPTARTLRPALDAFWNCAGYANSLSFDAGGKWLHKPQGLVE